jgi:acyl-coenzyme A synthetase/AMP-(fatty) acid ligase
MTFRGPLPNVEKLRALNVVDEIPRSASGKVLRRVLADRARS